MPSLKDLRVRIRSVRSTQKITSAMKMVAASRLRRAQEQAEAARPYAQRMERVLGSLSRGRLQRLDTARGPTADPRARGGGQAGHAVDHRPQGPRWLAPRLQPLHPRQPDRDRPPPPLLR